MKKIAALLFAFVCFVVAGTSAAASDQVNISIVNGDVLKFSFDPNSGDVTIHPSDPATFDFKTELTFESVPAPNLNDTYSVVAKSDDDSIVKVNSVSADSTQFILIPGFNKVSTMVTVNCTAFRPPWGDSDRKTSVTIKATGLAGEITASFAITVRPESLPNDTSSSPAINALERSNSSRSQDSEPSNDPTSSVPVGRNDVSGNVNPITGAVDPDKILEDASQALEQSSGTGTVSVTVRNAESIDADTLARLAEAAGGRPLLLYADSTAPDGSIIARLTIDVAKAAASGSGVGLRVGTGNRIVSKTFVKFFQNNVEIATFSQDGPFGFDVGFALRLDLLGFDPENLVFYSYNPLANRYQRVKADFTIDKNGFLHLTVQAGGCLVLSNGPLTLK